MARGGINKALVHKARQALLARGEHPSIDAVRVELGNTGSKTTIHRYLRELDDEGPLIPDARPSLSDELGALVAGLAGRLQVEANATLQAAEAAFAEERSGLRNELEQERRRCAELEAQAAQQQQAMAALQAETQQLQARLHEQQLELTRLDQLQSDQRIRLEERERQIASLEDKHRHAREALEHYRASVQAQREQEQRRHEAQVQQLQVELRQGQQALIVRQEEILQLNRDNERLLGELRGAHRERSELQEQQARLAGQQNELHAQLARLETRNAGQQEALERLEQSRQALGDELEQARRREVEQLRQAQQTEQALQVALARCEAELQLLRQARQAASTAPGAAQGAQE